MISYAIGILIGLWVCGIGYGWLALSSRAQTVETKEKLLQLFRIGGPIIVVANTLLLLSTFAR